MATSLWGRRTYGHLLVVITTAFLLGADPAIGCVCSRPSPATAFESSDLVVEGTAVWTSVVDLLYGSSEAGLCSGFCRNPRILTLLRVDRVWKGSPGPYLVLTTGMDSCSVRIPVGGRRILMVNRGPGPFSIWTCAATYSTISSKVRHLPTPSPARKTWSPEEGVQLRNSWIRDPERAPRDLVIPPLDPAHYSDERPFTSRGPRSPVFWNDGDSRPDEAAYRLCALRGWLDGQKGEWRAPDPIRRDTDRLWIEYVIKGSIDTKQLDRLIALAVSFHQGKVTKGRK